MSKASQPRRSTFEIAGIVLANAIKIAAAGVAFHEVTGSIRPEVLAFAAFMLTVATSIEQSITSYFAGKRGRR